MRLLEPVQETLRFVRRRRPKFVSFKLTLELGKDERLPLALSLVGLLIVLPSRMGDFCAVAGDVYLLFFGRSLSFVGGGLRSLWIVGAAAPLLWVGHRRSLFGRIAQ